MTMNMVLHVTKRKQVSDHCMQFGAFECINLTPKNMLLKFCPLKPSPPPGVGPYPSKNKDLIVSADSVV